MPALHLDDAIYDELDRLAGRAGGTIEELAAKCIRHGMRVADVHIRIGRLASLSEAERKRLADDAGDLATGAQLLALDAEDGGYEWGPDGPPGVGGMTPAVAPAAPAR